MYNMLPQLVIVFIIASLCCRWHKWLLFCWCARGRHRLPFIKENFSFLRLKCDVTFDLDIDLAGGRFVLKDMDGRVILEGDFFYHSSSTLMVETRAQLEGSRQAQRLKLYTDSLQLIQLYRFYRSDSIGTPNLTFLTYNSSFPCLILFIFVISIAP